MLLYRSLSKSFSFCDLTQTVLTYIQFYMYMSLYRFYTEPQVINYQVVEFVRQIVSPGNTIENVMSSSKTEL